MGKIAPVSSKYIIHTTIKIEGIVDKPDVIGAVFGQTEGLLGADLELRELQRSGRIGRIEVDVDTRSGKTEGSIVIPSSLDKAETAIVGASLEIIQRIGPCNAQLRVKNIEDVRTSKRSFVIERAKELLQSLQNEVMPDSSELADEVGEAVRVMEITEYGRDRLPAGPGIAEADEIIIVEGRADVLCLLKNGFKNVISLNGTSVPKTIIELSRQKDTVAFVDGDRGGNLIIKELLSVAELDFVTRAPDGKEVEELAKKEIHKALRSRLTAEQAKLELQANDTTNRIRKPIARSRESRPSTRRVVLKDDEKSKYGKMLEGLVGTRGAFILDNKMNVLGKVPTSELSTTIKSLKQGIHAIVFDGTADETLVRVAENANIKHVVAMDAKTSGKRVNVITATTL
ncbi:MAG: DNA primase DnaG [Candidatus Woesearchaeota archaeon]|jgi:DNA primase|nr:DNA primase DnaG [Candidatus Woesearchaeota archaeon]MDP7181699.1 DNA primase DnaG [Candidatus Woesearchaeota archaeon]MDP7198788.1 DNA primase DnaG [Candidatus Woesearchaeota archaeon]MDP7467212.1 DNA primase DnaG [Candidatus Woesearchaeota archaeon]MDP7647453.1 DNA primase DnaG [Candidatus Woesearchaeota archaeon]